jgi:hypothetical protein
MPRTVIGQIRMPWINTGFRVVRTAALHLVIFTWRRRAGRHRLPGAVSGMTNPDDRVIPQRSSMDSYTITIAANDDSGAATRLVVDTSGDRIRITDVHLHAPHGLSSGHMTAATVRRRPILDGLINEYSQAA